MPYVRVKKRRKRGEAAAAGPDWYKVGMRLLTVVLTLITAAVVIWMSSCERPAAPPPDQATLGQVRVALP